MTQLGSPHELYDFIEQIGDGSFGTVHKAKHKTSQKIVAVKVMKKKYEKIQDCQDQFEPKLLDLVPPHINIVQMYDSFFSTNGDLSFIMEFMDGGNLYQLMRERRQQHLPLSHCELRTILHQILSAVSHIHHHNVFHRDMKPENLLLEYVAGKPIIKLADFGLARELSSRPPYTEYVSTRWYRAPEVLLRSTEYSAPVDLWAVGAIFAELITLEPLFPGESEVDQIYRICDILGSPGNKLTIGKKIHRMVRPEKRPSPGFARKKTAAEIEQAVHSTLSFLDGGGEWKEGVKLAYKIGFKFPNCIPKPLETIIPGATESMLDLLRHFLLFNPTYRWSADTALKHAFFSETDEPVHNVIPLDIEPITPPDKHESIPIDRGLYSSKSHKSIITPLDLLPIPTSPHQICPDWDRPMSRLLSRPSTRTTHIDLFLHDVEPPSPSPTENAWLTQRPIYSSREKVHPVTDCPNTPIWSKYHYASHQQQRLATPHNHYHHYHHIHDNTVHTLSVGSNSNKAASTFSLDRIPQYGHQLIKWTPPIHFAVEPEVKRPVSRRSRSPVQFSVKNQRHTVNNHHHPQQKNSKPHRFNMWMPSDDDNDDDVGQTETQEDMDMVFLPLQ
ncbi:kinase-like protein [Rhizopus microsporus var. microsporus]|uniref:Kinase-like protein n=1 Tax=Rhizopus microsporus var. microsporus TaxID=86635 RepID=A0A1X0R019_RHIZD|nr:kinase-like protein [Rhizopus microsporus var. microsporus]